MSDTTSSSAADSPTPAPAPEAKSKKHSPLRLLLLIVLLLLVAFALWYDRKVAKPACEAGYEKAKALLDRELAKAGRVTASFKDMQQELGKKPSRRVDKEHYSIETYCWIRGSLVQSYYIHVIYRKERSGNLVVNNVLAPNTEATEEELPGGQLKPRQLTDEERAAMTPPPSKPGPAKKGAIGPGGPGKPPVAPDKPPTDAEGAAPPAKPGQPEAAPPEKAAPDQPPTEKPDAPAEEKPQAPAEKKP
jgi:hypothetical protein